MQNTHICQATGWRATSQKRQISIHFSLGIFFGTSMFIPVVFVLSRCVGSWHSMKGSPFCCLLCHPQATMSSVPPRLHNVYCATHRRKCYATASRSPGDTGYYCVRDKRLTHIKLIFRGLFSYYEFFRIWTRKFYLHKSPTTTIRYYCVRDWRPIVNIQRRPRHTQTVA